MAIDKKIDYEIQGGVKNYLGKQKEVTAPVKWKSSPNHPETELAYITKAEKDLLVKKDLHGSLKGGVNRGPSGIMSLNGFGSKDESQNVSGSQVSAAETGGGGSGMSDDDRRDFRSAAIAAGAGQRVYPGFFDDRNTVSRAELLRAKTFNPAAFKAGRRGGIMDFFTGGGFLGNLVRGIGQRFGLGKRFNEPYDRPQFAPGFATNPFQMQYDIGNEDLLNLLENEDERKTQTFTFDPSGMQRNDGIMSVARSDIDPQFQDMVRQVAMNEAQKKKALQEMEFGVAPEKIMPKLQQLDDTKFFMKTDDRITSNDLIKFYEDRGIKLSDEQKMKIVRAAGEDV